MPRARRNCLLQKFSAAAYAGAVAVNAAQYRINIDNVILAPRRNGSRQAGLVPPTPVIQQIRYQGEKVKFQRQLRGQALTVSQLIAALANQRLPLALAGKFMLPLVPPDGLLVSGHAAATLRLPQEPSLADVNWSAA